jgi:DNA topoisomerase III
LICLRIVTGFCVERHDEISSFKPETFWTLDAVIGDGSMATHIQWSRGRVFDLEVGTTLHKLVEKDSHLVCTDVKISQGRRVRPAPMNTGMHLDMMRFNSRRMK